MCHTATISSGAPKLGRGNIKAGVPRRQEKERHSMWNALSSSAWWRSAAPTMTAKTRSAAWPPTRNLWTEAAGTPFSGGGRNSGCRRIRNHRTEGAATQSSSVGSSCRRIRHLSPTCPRRGDRTAASLLSGENEDTEDGGKGGYPIRCLWSRTRTRPLRLNSNTLILSRQ